MDLAGKNSRLRNFPGGRAFSPLGSLFRFSARWRALPRRPPDFSGGLVFLANEEIRNDLLKPRDASFKRFGHDTPYAFLNNSLSS
jgi:hypothetical protein